MYTVRVRRNIFILSTCIKWYKTSVTASKLSLNRIINIIIYVKYSASVMHAKINNRPGNMLH